MADLIYSLYAAAANPSEWNPIATLLAEAHGAHSATLVVRDRSGGHGVRLTVTDNYQAEILAEYVAGGYRKNVWADQALLHPDQVLGSETIPDHHFERSEHYHLNCKPLGVFYGIGAAIPLSRDGDVALISIHRDRRCGPFEEQWKQQLQGLLPHFRQALQMRAHFQQIQLAQRISLCALEALLIGALVVDRDGYLLFANRIAENLVRTQCHLTFHRGRLQLDDPSQNAELGEAIRAMSDLGVKRPYTMKAGTLFGIPGDGTRRLILRVCPASETAFGAELVRPAAFLFISDASVETLPLRSQLVRLYGLTAAEARLAEAIANGQNLVEFCASSHLSRNTAKTHMKHIFAKTGHRRQSQFVRDVLGNPVLNLRPSGSESTFNPAASQTKTFHPKG